MVDRRNIRRFPTFEVFNNTVCSAIRKVRNEIAPKIGDPLCLGCYLDSFDLLMSNPMAAPAGAAIGLAVFSWAH